MGSPPPQSSRRQPFARNRRPFLQIPQKCFATEGDSIQPVEEWYSCCVAAPSDPPPPLSAGLRLRAAPRAALIFSLCSFYVGNSRSAEQTNESAWTCSSRRKKKAHL